MHKHFIKRFTRKDPVVIYNPIDYTPQKKIKNAVPHIGFVGRLVPLKWVNILVDALYGLRWKQRTCTIVGEWSERKNLEEQTNRLWLSERISFVGADDRINRLYKFDIVVNPSRQEWVPTTVIEALMQTCIVVATDVGGTKEISNKDDLIIIDAWSSEALTQWLEKALDSLGIWGTSYQHVAEQFSVPSAISHYTNVLLED